MPRQDACRGRLFLETILQNHHCAPQAILDVVQALVEQAASASSMVGSLRARLAQAERVRQEKAESAAAAWTRSDALRTRLETAEREHDQLHKEARAYHNTFLHPTRLHAPSWAPLTSFKCLIGVGHWVYGARGARVDGNCGSDDCAQSMPSC